LADIWHIREVAGVMLAGRWLDRVELDRRLLTWRSSGLHTADLSRPEPHPWLAAALNNVFSGARTRGEEVKEFGLYTLAALVDSLAAVLPSDRIAYEPLMRRVTAELGVIRASLKTPEQHVRFDPIARVAARAGSARLRGGGARRRADPMRAVNRSPFNADAARKGTVSDG
jgi:hypothetical protein